MNELFSLTAVAVLTLAIGTAVGTTNTRTIGDNEKLGKLVIKTAPVPEGGFADPKLEDTVKDLKKNKVNQSMRLR
jgi:hypothetical protein